MQLYYIRHAQSENNLLWARTGSAAGRNADPTLTERGQAQAHRLAQFLSDADNTDRGAKTYPFDDSDAKNLRGFHLTHLYTSLMLRAVATGTVVAQALGCPLRAWANLHETGGIFREDPETGELVGLPGKPRSFFETHYPDLELPDSLGEEGWWNRPFEHHGERDERARRVLRTLMERHGDSEDRVAFFSHGGFFNHLLDAVLGGLRGRDYWFVMNNVAITRIDFEDERASICYVNRTDFLPDELIT